MRQLRGLAHSELGRMTARTGAISFQGGAPYDSAMTDARHRCRVLTTLTEDEVGRAAVDLFIERVGAPPPTHVPREAYERLAADDSGREALRLIAERLDRVNDGD